MRPGTAGAGRALEWGQNTDQPGSRVRDVDGKPIFTGSKVELADGPGNRAIVRTVVELVDETTIRTTHVDNQPTRANIWRVVTR